MDLGWSSLRKFWVTKAEPAGKIAEIEVENYLKGVLREVLWVRKFKKSMRGVFFDTN